MWRCLSEASILSRRWWQGHNHLPVRNRFATMPKVRFIKENKEIEVPEGANLRQEALKAGIPLYRPLDRIFNCRGFGHCGTCHVFIKYDTIKNTSRKGLKERIRLALSWFAIGHEDEVRLSCQTKVLGDIEVETRPDWMSPKKKNWWAVRD